MNGITELNKHTRAESVGLRTSNSSNKANSNPSTAHVTHVLQSTCLASSGIQFITHAFRHLVTQTYLRIIDANGHNVKWSVWVIRECPTPISQSQLTYKCAEVWGSLTSRRLTLTVTVTQQAAARLSLECHHCNARLEWKH